MSSGEHPSRRPETEIHAEVAKRVQAELPLLAAHLRVWLEEHLTYPREIDASSDVDGTIAVRVWLVTDDTGDNDAPSRVVYNARRQMFGLVMELKGGVLLYMGPFRSLVAAVESI